MARPDIKHADPKNRDSHAAVGRGVLDLPGLFRRGVGRNGRAYELE
jgi:hypothetical protein